MKKLITILSFLALLAIHLFGQPDNSIHGNWLGVLKIPNAELKIGLLISGSNEDDLKVIMNSIDQGVQVPMNEVTLTEDTLLVRNPGAGIEFEGVVDLRSQTYSCEFRQGAARFPIIFKKVDQFPRIIRSQEPSPPFPYHQEDVEYENATAGVRIAGTLTIPQGDGPFPAAILLSGSGPQNRDEELFGHKPFLVLADYLTRQGIAVLRSDDRSVGGTTGEFQGSTTGDFTEDALAGVAFLKTIEKIDPVWIGLAGHSEGAMMAPIAAAQSSEVGFIVMMSGPGIPFSEIILFQRELRWKRMGNSEAVMDMKRKWHRKVSAITSENISDDEVGIKVHKYWEGLSEEEQGLLNKSKQDIDNEIKALIDPWWRYANKYDAGETLSQVRCPVLAINGSKDMQVESDKNLSAIEEALKSSKHKNYRVEELESLNHMFQTAETGDESEYMKIEETFSEEAMKVIADWILEQAGM